VRLHAKLTRKKSAPEKETRKKSDESQMLNISRIIVTIWGDAQRRSTPSQHTI